MIGLMDSARLNLVLAKMVNQHMFRMKEFAEILLIVQKMQKSKNDSGRY